MLLTQFIEQDLHFIINLFAALVFFAVFWLYFDAWSAKQHRKSKADIAKWAAFLLLSIAFLMQSTVIEQSSLGHSPFGNTTQVIANLAELIGFIGIIIAELFEPLQKKPETKGLQEILKEDQSTPVKSAGAAALGSTNSFGSIFALPVAALAVAVLYWRRATKGLERHLRAVALVFLLLALYELCELSFQLRGTLNPSLFNLVKAFGPLWLAAEVLLLAAAAVMGRWVWKYLVERFVSQLYIVFTAITLAIFAVITVSFTFLLLSNLQNSALNNMQTASKVLNYALQSKEAATLADAQSVAANPQVITAIQNSDHQTLKSIESNFLSSKHVASMIITTSSAQVLLRAEDPSHWGDSISSDTLVRRALIGDSVSTIATAQGVLAPVVTIRSSVPVETASHAIVGSVTVAADLNNAFVDGLKSATGLDTSIYSGKTLSATTFLSPDGVTRWTDVTEDNTAVTNRVLHQGRTFKGTTSILNQQFLGVFTPLTDINNSVVGMLFIGQSQAAVLQTIGHSIELTFIIAAVLLVLTILPAYYLAKYIAKQLK